MFFRIASPAISWVGSGGRPGSSVYAAPNRSSRNRQSIARPSFTSAWSPSTIWSSRARNRSLCPLSRRSFGRSPCSPTHRLGATGSCHPVPRNLQAFRIHRHGSRQNPHLRRYGSENQIRGLWVIHGRRSTQANNAGLIRFAKLVLQRTGSDLCPHANLWFCTESVKTQKAQRNQ